MARRSQLERTTETRQRLLDATIECLYELGYAKTTTPEIAKRAGLSRGAQLHHFPTKAELVTTALEHLLHRREREFRAVFSDLPAGADRGTVAIDLLWKFISGPTFYAWLELLVAARTDDKLRSAVKQVADRFRDSVRRAYRDLFPTGVPDIAPVFTFALLEGLAVDRICCDVPEHAEVIARLKNLAQVFVPKE